MKALLISVNSKYVHSSLSVWYLKAAAQHICDISVLETTIHASMSELSDQIVKSGADVIAFSCYIWNINFIGDLVKLIPDDRKIVLGGPEVSYNAQQVFENHPSVDYIISGEGELPFANLLSAIKNRQDVTAQDGICTRNCISSPHISSGTPVNPYTEEYFKRLNGRIVYFESSRGCPYSCSYCLSGRLGGVRFFDMDYVERTLKALACSGTSTVKFVDRTFNCDRNRATHIVRFLKQLNEQHGGVCYHFEIAGDLIDGHLLHELCTAPAGLFQVEIGIQSFNDRTLCAVNRKTNLQAVEKGISTLLESNNIHVHVDLIAGLPDEDFLSFRQGFDRLFALRPHMLQLGFLKLLHGSPLDDNRHGCFEYTPPYQVRYTDHMSEGDLQTLQNICDAVDRLYNSGRFVALIEAALEQLNSAFDLFLAFANEHSVPHGEPLDRYCERVLQFFSPILGRQPTLDLLKSELLCVSSSGKLPKVLQQENMRHLLKRIELSGLLPRPSGVKRAAAILHDSEQILIVDYIDRHPISGRFKAQFIKQDDLI